MSHGRRVSVIGLGYVGLPVAVAFGRQGPVVGFDVDARRVAELAAGRDRTREIEAGELASARIRFTSDPEELRACDFHVVAVPTPVDEARRPNLGPLLAASRSLGPRLARGDVVVYESTVYPGATEEECVPALEESSGLRCGSDFFVGYSPERINPGDRAHTLTRLTKVVSAQNAATLAVVAAVYESVVSAGVYRAVDIRTAEAAKIIENAQRDINIAFVNELALLFDRLGLDTGDVLAAAGTKWNFLPFRPGLVGGHCIGVDPYYLAHRATISGYSPQMLLAGRRINDGMGRFVAGQMVKALIREGGSVRDAVVTVLGLSFKEDVPDLRNSRVIDIASELEDFGVEVQIHDPLVDPVEARREYGVEVREHAGLGEADGVVLAVAHRAFVEAGWTGVTRLLKGGRGAVVDVRGMLDRDRRPEGVRLWRL